MTIRKINYSHRFIPFRRALHSVALTAGIVAIIGLSGCGGSDQEKAQNFVDKGVQQMSTQNLPAAKIEFTNAIRLDPESKDALYYLSILMEQEKNWPEFERYLTKLVEIEPEHIEARLRLANFYLGSGRIDVAKSHSEYLLKIDPNNLDIQLTRAAILLKTGESQDAMKLIENVLVQDPKHIDALFLKVSEQIHQQQFESALVTINSGLEAHPNNLALNMGKLKVLSQLNDWPAMVEVYNHLAALFPKNAAPVTSLAKGFAQRGDIDKAISILESFAEANNDPAYYIQTVDLIYATQGSEVAEQKLKSYITQNPQLDLLSLSLADIYTQSNRYTLAREQLNNILSSTTSTEAKIECYVRLGTLDFVEKEYASAQKLADKALALESEHDRATALKGNVLIRRGKLEDAVKILRTALRKNPESSELLFALGRAHEQMGKLDLAEEYYGKAHKSAPNNVRQNILFTQFLLRRNRLDYAERILSPIVSNGTTNPQVWSVYTQIKIAYKDWVAAQKALQQLVALTGETAHTLMLKAQLQQGQGDLQDSVKTLITLNKLSPQNPAALTMLVDAYVKTGKTKEAKKHLNTTLNSHPEFLPAQYLLAQLEESSQQLNEALVLYRSIVQSAPKEKNAHSKIVQILIKQKKLPDAQKALSSALTSVPNDPELELLQAALYKEQGDIDGTISAYEKILKQHPRFDVAANNLAITLQELGGEENLKKASNIANRFRQSQNPIFIDTLGWIYVQQDNIDEGLALLRRAADMLPQEGEVQYHLGTAFAKADKPELATRTLEKALKLGNQNASAAPWVEAAKKELDLLNLNQ